LVWPPPAINAMQPFDYLSVLISIVLGLGITQILQGFSGWLGQRDQFRPYFPAVLWAITLLVAHIQTWWSMFGLRHADEWTFLQFSAVLMQPVVLYMLSTLVLSGASGAADMRTNFQHHRRWFFGFFLLLLVVSLLKDLIRMGHLPAAENLAFHAVLFLIGGVGLGDARDVVQRAVAASAFLAVLAYVALLFADLA